LKAHLQRRIDALPPVIEKMNRRAIGSKRNRHESIESERQKSGAHSVVLDSGLQEDDLSTFCAFTNGIGGALTTRRRRHSKISEG